jgi:hypothetical protein
MQYITEKELQSTVIGWAETYGWLVYHQVDMGFQDPTTGKWKHSRRIGPGFPDLVLVHPKRGRLIFAELKPRRERSRRINRNGWTLWITPDPRTGRDTRIWSRSGVRATWMTSSGY